MNKKSTFIVFIFFFTINSCSLNKIKPPIYIGEMRYFDENQKNELLDLLQDFNKNFNNSIFTNDKSGHSEIYFEFYKKNEFEKSSFLAGTATNFLNSCKITIYPISYTSQILKTVLWHELGHCFGLEHSENPSDIMYHSAVDFDFYSQESINFFIKSLKESFK